LDKLVLAPRTDPHFAGGIMSQSQLLNRTACQSTLPHLGTLTARRTFCRTSNTSAVSLSHVGQLVPRIGLAGFVAKPCQDSDLAWRGLAWPCAVLCLFLLVTKMCQAQYKTWPPTVVGQNGFATPSKLFVRIYKIIPPHLYIGHQD